MFIAWLAELLRSEEIRGASLLIGVLVAIVSVRTARQLARKKQAADVIFAIRNDKGLSDGFSRVTSLHDGNDNMRKFADNMLSPEATEMRYVLNHFEYVSVCIQKGIFDEHLIKDCSYGTVIKLYKQALPFIEAVREKHARPTIWQELEWLANRWEKAPLKKRGPNDKRWRFWW